MKPLMITTLMFALCGAVSAQDRQLTDIKDDLRIMTDIIENAFGIDRGAFPRRSSDGELKPRQIDSSYLKGQGVIFRFKLDRGMDRFFFDHIGLESAFVPLAPDAPGGSVGWTVSTTSPASEDVRVALAEAQELSAHLADTIIASSDELSAVLEALPNASGSELESELRALRSEHSRAIAEIREEIGETRKELISQELDAEARKSRRESIARLRADLEATKKEYNQKLDAIKAERLETWEAKLGEFETMLLDTVCARGGNLRAMPDGEHVTLIVEDAYRSQDGKPQDKIYIFKKRDLLDCRDGKIDKAGLLSRGNVYRF